MKSFFISFGYISIGAIFIKLTGMGTLEVWMIAGVLSLTVSNTLKINGEEKK